jgi:hypothetical protein
VRALAQSPGAWLVVAPLALACLGQAQAGSAKVLLPCACTTSAGVFDSAGRLIRTLWSGKAYAAGPLKIEWDGHDDDGKVAASERFRARVLAHHVRYEWEGVIGNTSREFTGAHVFRAANPINAMAIDARGNAFYVVGYNEQQPAIRTFSTDDPQRTTALAHDDYRRVFKYAATDGQLAYFANVGLAAPRSSPMRDAATFVVALRVSDGSEYQFALGRAVFPDPKAPESNRWNSAVDYRDGNLDASGEFLDAPSGLAVQRRGDALFVAHRQLNLICVLDKHDGRILANIAVERPGALAVARDDSLWAVSQVPSAPALVHFNSVAGQWLELGRNSGGLQNPVALGISPLDGTVVVADAGSEQLKGYSDSGTPRWTFGQAGGYREGDPEVRSDRLWLSAGASYVAFQSDGSLWVGDPGNARNLHLSAQRQLLGQIMYMPKSYHVAVDQLEPTRVFDRFLEFSVDYSRPLRDSWRLVRNWKAGLDESYDTDLEGLREVITLANGHTYGLVPRRGAVTTEVVELSPKGLRATGTHLDFGVKLYADGSLRFAKEAPPGFAVYTRKLVSFDRMDNPQWGAPEVLVALSRVIPEDPYYHDVPQGAGVNEPTFPETDSGMVVLFSPGRSTGYHLGGLRPGEDRWWWRASPSGHWTVDANGGITSRDGTYELGRGVQYPGSIVTVAGPHIIYGYHGEAWNGGQANQWMHYRDDGLFIGQFGVPVYPAQNRIEAHAGAAGNAFSPQLVSVRGRVYLWHNDEGVHGGVHRWRIEGAQEIQTLEVPIEP